MPTPTHVVPKNWGEEHWIVNGAYCGKKLVLKRGHRCSLHYHKDKDEVFYVIRGRVFLELGGVEEVLEPGDHRHDLAHLNRGPGGPSFDPAQVELLPALQSSLGGCPGCVSTNQGPPAAS